jgi:hypothetical protein
MIESVPRTMKGPKKFQKSQTKFILAYLDWACVEVVKFIIQNTIKRWSMLARSFQSHRKSFLDPRFPIPYTKANPWQFLLTEIAAKTVLGR